MPRPRHRGHPVTACRHPGCAGTIAPTGFCRDCGRRPPPARPTPAPPPPPVGAPASSGDDLMALPTLRVDPSELVIDRPRPPEGGRPCAKEGCDAVVGAAHRGEPPLSRGFCPACRTPFSLEPRLRPGDLLADQYRVTGYLSHGGLGWLYLAQDTRLDDHPVVLKGLIDSHDATARRVAGAERRFLTDLDHPNIVRIVNYVTHPPVAAGPPPGTEPEARGDPGPDPAEPTDYIVMEFVPGRSLRQLVDGRLPLSPEDVLVYGCGILDALDYLHGKQLLYCDMKPDNVIHYENRIKVVDLGGVRRFDDRDTPVVVTRGYLPPDEIARHGLGVRSDLHTVGVTLRELMEGVIAPPPGLGADSLRRVIDRATRRDPAERFASATEMAVQLRGVLREIRSLRSGREFPEPSTLFAPAAGLLDSGLGRVPRLERWTGHAAPSAEAASDTATEAGTNTPAERGAGDRAGPGWLRAWGGVRSLLAGPPGAEPAWRRPEVLDPGLPTAYQVATELPVPYPHPEDPAAALLTALESSPAQQLVEQVGAVRPRTVEVALCLGRAELRLGRLPVAGEWLAAAARLLGSAAARDWRLAWHRGLLALAGGDVAAANAAFDAVYAALPGEYAPKLALGYCAERLGRPELAGRYYEAVWRRNRSQGSAAFGLVRLRLARGDRRGAVEILDRVPEFSPHHSRARIAAVRILVGRLADGPAPAEGFREAARRLPNLYPDEGGAAGDARDRLTAEVRELALDRVLTERGEEWLPSGPLLGEPPTEERLRRLLETSLRDLARQARHAGEHGALVDLANAVRPMTLR
ncbi:serine/threonine-protein kinase [Allostreptomyces psammosilenae]|uniref:non-specific serine/threonine protein kinase n=1 Tax=Allostreptomyces psammosilenae TaxID=1892865 RepID=A0A853A3J7_9ACTN|nr:serine/threonine-protein kinase [Allostreptomyces psammosilenae]NYI05082.1 serine/threonine-protein kinase PknG [Allostreptomyces psammosilenae]